MIDKKDSKGKNFTKTWSEVINLNNLLAKLLGVALVANAALVTVVMNKDTEFILLPPELDKKIVVSANKAGKGYKEAWAVFVAQLVGNVTPSNASFMLDSVGSLFAADVYQRFKSSLEEQAETIKMKRASVSFYPEQVHYNPVNETVFVFGRETVKLPSGDDNVSVRTFEVKVVISQGYPKVVYFDTYKGKPNREGM